MCWTGEKGIPGTPGYQVKMYCPKCGSEYIMFRSDKWAKAALCLSFGCTWAGVEDELMNSRELLTFQRKNKLKKLCNDSIV